MTGSKLLVRHLEITDHEPIVDYFLNSDKDFLGSMGVDTLKLPSKQEWLNLLNSNFTLSVDKKKFFYMIWLLDDQPVGHSNINKIIYSNEAYMHLHLWQKQIRQKGMGVEFLKLTIPYYFEIFQLENLFCEPSAYNPAPNKTLEKAGFDFIKSYDTVPGWINFYQTVNLWCLSKEKFKTL
jgi:hypothetical protein